MKALITGGAGFIGSNIAALLLEKGHEVTVLDNLMSGYHQNIQDLPLSFIHGDVCNAETVKSAARGMDVIFHLAASVGNKRSIDNPILDSQINVLGTLNVLEAARFHGVRKVVASSSAGIFGELKTMPIREDHPVEPDTPYGASKLAGEKMCLAYARLYDMECVCLRYFNVYGVKQRYDAYGNVIPIFVHKILAGEPITIFGDGEQTRDFINVRDVAAANYAAALSKGVSGAFNLGSGTHITINHLVELLRRFAGMKFHVEYGPPRKGDVRHSLADLSQARERLGFTPSVKMEEGLPAYIEWAKTALTTLAAGAGRR
ncbi:MAG TPA: NAD-dependent epimerase/dehydratase family protein [Candidatus Limnocylindrales bacterium]|nr:NAD-dependent epimerase/dehydratase family protein [Candidatus Limnocylindrales bacterium]